MRTSEVAVHEEQAHPVGVFSISLEKPLVDLVKRRIPIRTVKF